MNHTDHVNLIHGGVPIGNKQTWADFGSGTGAFTLALANVLGPDAVIHSIDRDTDALHTQAEEMRRRFPHIALHTYPHDYTHPLDLPRLDGIVASNTLHFQRDADKPHVVRLLKSYLRHGGRLIIVEYNVDAGNYAVPHPLPFSAWQALAHDAGFAHTKLLATRPSRFLREIYSAVSWEVGL